MIDRDVVSGSSYVALNNVRRFNYLSHQITRGIHTDSLLNYETIKYFVGEEHEGRRYADAIAKYQALEYKVIASLNLLNFVQSLIIVSFKSFKRCLGTPSSS